MTLALDDRAPSGGMRAMATLVRWTGAAAVVCGLHAGGLWFALHWRPAAVPPGDQSPAVMIDLAPIAVAPEAPPQEVAPGPTMTETQPEPAPDRPEPSVETARAEPAPPVVEPERVPVEEPPPPQPQPEVRVPDLPSVPNAEAVLAPPPPPPKPQVQRPPPRPVERTVRRPVDPARPRTPRTTAPPTSQAQRAETAAAPAPGASAASAVSASSWRGALMAHLNRFKRAPSGAAAGTAQVAFTIDRGGRVLSSRLVSSSGDAALDAEAVAMMRRASPVPAPPASVAGATPAFSVPVRFSR